MHTQEWILIMDVMFNVMLEYLATVPLPLATGLLHVKYQRGGEKNIITNIEFA